MGGIGPDILDRDVDGPAPLIDDFRILSVLASNEGVSSCVAVREGAFGFHKRVMLKLADAPFDAAPDVNLRITQEARIGMHLSHPNLLQILDLSRDAGRTFLVREWVDGLGLRALLRRRWSEGRVVPVPAVLRIGMGVARALHYLHNLRAPLWAPRGISHRVVTPSNILLSRFGEVRLANLSLADPAERFDSEARSVSAGQYPAFCAPEVLEGAGAGHAADVFSLGAVLFEALVGPTALIGPADSDWTRTRAELDLCPAVEAAAELPPALKKILLWGMHRVPEERPAAGDFKDALRRYLFTELQSDGEDELRTAISE